MTKEKKTLLTEFARKAMQSIQDKQVPKRRRLYVPSIGQEVVVRGLKHNELMEVMNTDNDERDPNRADKLAVYKAMIDPNLAEVASEIKALEADAPIAQRTVIEPLDVLNIFSLADLNALATHTMELSGVMVCAGGEEVRVVEDLKN